MIDFEGNRPKVRMLRLVGLWCLTQLSTIFQFYLTLCMFSFEINESRLSDTKCLIQNVVSPHCGDKRMAQRCTRRSLPNYLVMTSYHWNVREITVTWHRWMNDKITWRLARNVVSLRILYKFYFNPCYLFEIRFYWNVR